MLPSQYNRHLTALAPMINNVPSKAREVSNDFPAGIVNNCVGVNLVGVVFALQISWQTKFTDYVSVLLTFGKTKLLATVLFSEFPLKVDDSRMVSSLQQKNSYRL